jgi:elongation factor P
MLSYNELKPGLFIVYEGSVCEVLEASFLRMQQRKPVMKVKLRDLISGKVKETSFQQSDELEEADLERMKARFLYANRGEYWFDEAGNPKNRFALKESDLANKGQFLKANCEVVALMFGEKIISVQLPIKVDLEVTEAPPAIKGDTASGGSKQVTLETGAKVNTPFFINTGDVVRVNTETGQYVERVEKA